MRQIVLVLLSALAVASSSAAAGPAPQPEPEASRHALAEQLYQAARSAPKADDAIAALNRALEYDPNHIQANLSLAEILIDRKQIGLAEERLSRIGTLAKQQPDVSAAVKGRLDALRQRLDRLRQAAANWSTLKKQFAESYESLARTAAPTGMPTTAMIYARAASLQPDNARLAAQMDRALAAVPPVPAPQEKTDATAARILHGQAVRRVSEGRYAEASDLLKSVVTLDPENVEAWCNLAACRQHLKDLPLAGSCLFQAQKRLAGRSDPDAAARIAKVRILLTQVDPRWRQVQELDQQIAAAGRRLADQAAAANDQATAEEIEKFLTSFGFGALPVPAAAGPASTGPATPAMSMATYDLSVKTVKIDALAGTAVKQLRDHFVVGPVPGLKIMPEKLVATATLGSLTFAGDSRIRWRIEPLEAANRAMLTVGCWPLRGESIHRHVTIQEAVSLRRMEINDYPLILKDYERTVLPSASREQLFREDGVYEVCFEKVGNRVAVWIGPGKLLEVTLNPQQMELAAKLRIQLYMGFFYAAGRNAGGKFTLLELTTGTALPPYAPPEVQGTDPK